MTIEAERTRKKTRMESERIASRMNAPMMVRASRTIGSKW